MNPITENDDRCVWKRTACCQYTINRECVTSGTNNSNRIYFWLHRLDTILRQLNDAGFEQQKTFEVSYKTNETETNTEPTCTPF